MPRINVLDKDVAVLIAAGEVVERPASVIKELVENSIDAKSTSITVEIKNGGVTFMRVSDNGCGIEREDVKRAFLRHATSKIRIGTDLENISTLGFRGEALAAIAAVARVELITKTADEPIGTRYEICGGDDKEPEDAGRAVGTTVTVCDVFFNTPARMKFLKKDVSEGNAVAALVDRLALSHPEISFKLIRDGKQTLATPGDGKLMSAVYSVCGRDFSSSLIPAEGETGGIGVSGFISRPVFCRPNRNGQYVFVNSRFVRSGTVTAALEQAYKNSIMVGRFPAAVLHISIPAGAVDVNVHPAKTEVRFSDERRVFDGVYYAVKNALASDEKRPTVDIGYRQRQSAFENLSAAEYRQTVIGASQKPQKTERSDSPAPKPQDKDGGTVFRVAAPGTKPFEPFYEYAVSEGKKYVITPPGEKKNSDLKGPEKEAPAEINVRDAGLRYVGEAFGTYVIVEKGDSLFLIDKHAAHERMIFDRLVASREIAKQILLTPETVELERGEYSTVIENLGTLENAGFDIEDFGGSSVVLRGVPSELTGEDGASIVRELASALAEKNAPEVERLETVYSTVACKAAIKAGYKSTEAELLSLAEKVLGPDGVKYCPHGRPVAFEMKKRDVEKQFGRIQ